MSKTLDSTLAALSHADRRDMLERLSAGDMRVSELAEPYDMSLNAASKHIKVLEAAGLINREQRGREHYISIEPKPMQEVADMVHFFSRFWGKSFDQLDRLLEEEQTSDEKPDADPISTHCTDTGFLRPY